MNVKRKPNIRLEGSSTSENFIVISDTLLSDGGLTVYISPGFELEYDYNNTIHGGINYNQHKNRDFIYDVVRPHGAKTSLGIPVNVVTVGVGEGQGITTTGICVDEHTPNQKVDMNFSMTVGKDSSNDGNHPASASLDYIFKIKGHLGSPFTMISGTLPDGANKAVHDLYRNDVIITNLHSDTTYFENDIPLQGPFSETWVGGRQARHIEINRYDADKIGADGIAPLNNIDGQYTRPEGFRILFGEHPDEYYQDGALGFVGGDTGGDGDPTGYSDLTRRSCPSAYPCSRPEFGLRRSTDCISLFSVCALTRSRARSGGDAHGASQCRSGPLSLK